MPASNNKRSSADNVTWGSIDPPCFIIGLWLCSVQQQFLLRVTGEIFSKNFEKCCLHLVLITQWMRVTSSNYFWLNWSRKETCFLKTIVYTKLKWCGFAYDYFIDTCKPSHSWIFLYYRSTSYCKRMMEVILTRLINEWMPKNISIMQTLNQSIS